MVTSHISPAVSLLRGIVAFIFALACATASGETPTTLKVSSMFGDHMVLQRDMPVTVWGTAGPGDVVTVSFGEQKMLTKTGTDGRWKLNLEKLEASAKPREMTIESSEKIVIKDVLVGEVWICSGQSNMQFGWGKQSRAEFNWGGVKELAALADEARKLPIRSYFVPMNVSLKEEESCQGEWSDEMTGSAVGFGFSYYLHQKLKVPVAVIVSCWGSSSIEGWMPLDMTEQLPHFKGMMDKFEREDRQKIEAKIEQGINAGDVFARTRPNILYNAMLHPVIPYTCRGMVWYQGEANSSQGPQYGITLPLWVKRLRKSWGRDDFHFLAVMLPGYGKGGRWPAFREAQMKILDLPHTAVANTIDLGHITSIHPSDKEPIGKRLALLARRHVHREAIMGQGPMFKSIAKLSRTKDNGINVAFTDSEGLKTNDGKAPLAFEVSDESGKWHPAQATIQGEVIQLKCAEAKRPVRCRYAFSAKPAVNLINAEGLPAYPFITDIPETKSSQQNQ